MFNWINIFDKQVIGPCCPGPAIPCLVPWWFPFQSFVTNIYTNIVTIFSRSCFPIDNHQSASLCQHIMNKPHSLRRYHTQILLWIMRQKLPIFLDASVSNTWSVLYWILLILFLWRNIHDAWAGNWIDFKYIWLFTMVIICFEFILGLLQILLSAL